MSDAISGSLTVNLSSVNIEGQTAKAVFDIRYPVTVSGNRVLKQFKKVAKISDLRLLFSITKNRFMPIRTASL